MGASGSDEGSLPLETRISKPWALEWSVHTKTSPQLPITNYLTKCVTDQGNSPASCQAHGLCTGDESEEVA